MDVFTQATFGHRIISINEQVANIKGVSSGWVAYIQKKKEAIKPVEKLKCSISIT